MSTCAERISHYAHKAKQHLHRVRLSHFVATTALRGDVSMTPDLVDLIHAAIDLEPANLHNPKLQVVPHKVHLVGLKANFELFLNRVLTAVWAAHFDALIETVPLTQSVRLLDLAHLLPLSGNVTPVPASCSSTSSYRPMVVGYSWT